MSRMQAQSACKRLMQLAKAILFILLVTCDASVHSQSGFFLSAQDVAGKSSRGSLQVNHTMVPATTSRQHKQPPHKAHSYQKDPWGQTSEMKLRLRRGIMVFCLCLCIFTYVVHKHFKAGVCHLAMSSRTDDAISSTRGDPSLRNAFWFFGGLFASVAYSAVISTAYDTAVLLGGGAATSGFLISIYPPSAVAGYLFIRAVAGRRAIVYKSSLIAATLMIGLSSCVYCITGLGGNLTQLLASRAVLGFFGGAFSFMRTDIKMRLLLPEEMARAQLIEIIGLGIGLTSGPMYASAVLHILNNVQTDPLIALTASASLVTVIATIPFSFLLHYTLPPDLNTAAPLLASDLASDVRSGGTGDTRASKIHQHSEYNRTKLIVCILIMNFLNQIVFQCAEIGSSLIFEIGFSWQAKNVGLAIGGCTLIALPLSPLIEMWMNRAPVKSVKSHRVDFLVLIPCLASLLFLPVRVAPIPGELPILMADVIILAMCIVSLARFQGLYYTLADHDPDHKWSAFNLGAYDQLTYLGRGLAGPLSRGVLGYAASSHIINQKAYAILLLALQLSAWAVYRLMPGGSESECEEKV